MDGLNKNKKRDIWRKPKLRILGLNITKSGIGDPKTEDSSYQSGTLFS